ncbi:MAG TPA: dienelactone hydrolase family protein, partial [Pyrinomonadaceae bacterium]|nr:dienelactone hydrolase family protein [Pyrinomonadaceae bacterium]
SSKKIMGSILNFCNKRRPHLQAEEARDFSTMSADQTAMHQDQTIPAEIKLYYDLYVPDDEQPHPLLVALHGYGANKRQMMREARELAPPGFAIASLQGFHQHIREPKEKGGPLRYGFGWVTNFHSEESIALHHRALLDLIAKLTDHGAVDPRRIFLLGFSQSCALNYRFAFTYAERLRGVVGICGGLPGDWEASERYSQTRAAVLHLCGARDEFYPPERVEDYGARLKERARDVEVKSYDAGHEIVPRMREDVRSWLRSHAQQP